MNTRIALAQFALTAIKSVRRELLGIRTMSQSKQSAMLSNSAPRVEMWPSPKLSDKRMQSRRNDDEVYDDGYLRVEHKRYFVACKETQIALSKTEFRLFSRMARSMDRVVRAVELWEHAWGLQKPLNNESLHVTMCRVRRKFEAYRFKDR